MNQRRYKGNMSLATQGAEQLDYFERKTYESHFSKEEIEIVRWDQMDCEALVTIFRNEQIRQAAESLVSYVEQYSETDDMKKKLGRYLYPAGRFDNMMLFLRCAVQAEGYVEMLDILNQNLAQANPYNEPLWVLWGRFITDVLDALRQWTCCKDKVMERLPYF